MLRKLFLLFLLPIPLSTINAQVSQSVADSIADILNHGQMVCNSSCPLYTSAQPLSSTILINTLFISLLVIIGSLWLYSNYKKKYHLIIGATIIIALAASLFLHKETQPECASMSTCPMISDSMTEDDTAFETDLSDFEQIGSSAIEDDTQSQSQNIDADADNDLSDFSDEFSSEDDSDEKINEIIPVEKKLEWTDPSILDPILIFAVLLIIGIFSKYPGFIKFRGLFLLLGLIWLGFYRGGCSCMINSFQNLVLGILTWDVVWKSLVWIAVLAVATYLFGRVWCGWLCHFGALQEFLYKSEKLKILTSDKAQKTLEYIRNGVFVLWIVQLIMTRSNIFCHYDPFKSIFNLIVTDWVGYLLVGILLLSSVLIYRPFCRIICPVGVLLGKISQLPGAKRIAVNNDSCIHCGACKKECKEGAVSNENNLTSVNNNTCIACTECVGKCKKQSVSFSRKPFHSVKKVLFIVFFIFAGNTVSAQWDCPSRLGAALKPIGKSDFMWAFEGTVSAGWVKSHAAGNLVGIAGFNYSKNKHTVYLEGGIKGWLKFNNKEMDYIDDNGNITTHKYFNGNILPGLREAFYRFEDTKNTLTLGLQSAQSEDPYLLNERIVGMNYQGRFGMFKLNVIGGTVLQAFARNGRFCTLGYTYDVVAGRPRSSIGKGFGETTFALASFAFLPKKKKKNTTELDDFGSEDTEKKSNVKFHQLGVIAYSEFGNWFSTQTYLGGLYAEMDFWGIYIKPEILIQGAKQNMAVIYNLTIDKKIFWNAAHTTRLFGRYTDYSPINKNARPINSLSNLFAGEVLRLDVLDAPFVQLGIKHSFTKIKLSIKLQGAFQTRASKIGGDYGFVADQYISPLCRMQEFDITLSKNFGKLVYLNATFGLLCYPNLSHTDFFLHYNRVETMFGKLECRITL